jgi:hypothetical protein
MIALGMSLEGAHASNISELPYGEAQPLNGGSSPAAYYYNGVTYVTWQGANLGIYVASYTYSTGTWSAPVFVAPNPLTNDDHGAPAITVDNNGYIHIMYGAHNSAQKYVKSTNPGDISAWTAMPDPVSATRGATYPQLLKDSSGYLHLIYRSARVGDPTYNDFVEDIVTSTDGGATWSAPQDVINIHSGSGDQAVYLLGGGAEYESATNRIHLTWVRYNATSGYRENLYYAYLNLNDNKMYSISGVNLGSTINQTEADAHCRIVHSGTNRQTDFARVRVDPTGNPYIIYLASVCTSSYPTVSCSLNEYNFTRWTGSSWTAPITITTTGAGSSSGNEFFIHSSTNIEAYFIGSTGSVQEWSWDGTTWSEVLTVLAQPSIYGLDFPMEVVNGVDFKIVFCETNYNNYAVSNLGVFAYGTITRLIIKRRS